MELETLPDIGLRVDHIAIAVRDLPSAVAYFSERLGFTLSETRETTAESTGMHSAVMRRDTVTFVLLEGTNAASPVSRFVERYGPGVHHVALHVNGLDDVVADLQQNGLAFSTSIVRSSSLHQTFSERDDNSGMMFELIERGDFPGFDDGNVKQLFADLESSRNV